MSSSSFINANAPFGVLSSSQIHALVTESHPKRGKNTRGEKGNPPRGVSPHRVVIKGTRQGKSFKLCPNPNCCVMQRSNRANDCFRCGEHIPRKSTTGKASKPSKKRKNEYGTNSGNVSQKSKPHKKQKKTKKVEIFDLLPELDDDEEYEFLYAKEDFVKPPSLTRTPSFVPIDLGSKKDEEIEQLKADLEKLKQLDMKKDNQIEQLKADLKAHATQSIAFEKQLEDIAIREGLLVEFELAVEEQKHCLQERVHNELNQLQTIKNENICDEDSLFTIMNAPIFEF